MFVEAFEISGIEQRVDPEDWVHGDIAFEFADGLDGDIIYHTIRVHVIAECPDSASPAELHEICIQRRSNSLTALLRFR